MANLRRNINNARERSAPCPNLPWRVNSEATSSPMAASPVGVRSANATETDPRGSVARMGRRRSEFRL